MTLNAMISVLFLERCTKVTLTCSIGPISRDFCRVTLYDNNYQSIFCLEYECCQMY